MSNAMDGTDDDMLWNDNEEDGNVGVNVRKMKALTMKIETATLIGKGG
jgi:hypothetical protein